jgi:hypothetical protein
MKALNNLIVTTESLNQQMTQVESQIAALLAQQDERREQQKERQKQILLATADRVDLMSLPPAVLAAGLVYISRAGRDPSVAQNWVDEAQNDNALNLQQPRQRSGGRSRRNAAAWGVNISANPLAEERDLVEACGMKWNGRRVMWTGNPVDEDLDRLLEVFGDRLVDLAPRPEVRNHD